LCVCVCERERVLCVWVCVCCVSGCVSVRACVCVRVCLLCEWVHERSCLCVCMCVYVCVHVCTCLCVQMRFVRLDLLSGVYINISTDRDAFGHFCS